MIILDPSYVFKTTANSLNQNSSKTKLFGWRKFIKFFADKSMTFEGVYANALTCTLIITILPIFFVFLMPKKGLNIWLCFAGKGVKIFTKILKFRRNFLSWWAFGRCVPTFTSAR